MGDSSNSGQYVEAAHPDLGDDNEPSGQPLDGQIDLKYELGGHAHRLASKGAGRRDATRFRLGLGIKTCAFVPTLSQWGGPGRKPCNRNGRWHSELDRD